jgi:hypothetical protein
MRIAAEFSTLQRFRPRHDKVAAPTLACTDRPDH